MARKFTSIQQYRFPVMMSAIIGGIGFFYYNFSRMNHDRIKEGSRRFTEAPKSALQENISADK